MKCGFISINCPNGNHLYFWFEGQCSTYWRTVLKTLVCWWSNQNQTAASECWRWSGYLQAGLDRTTPWAGYPRLTAQMVRPKLSRCRGPPRCQIRWSGDWGNIRVTWVTRHPVKTLTSFLHPRINSTIKLNDIAWHNWSQANHSAVHMCAQECHQWTLDTYLHAE